MFHGRTMKFVGLLSLLTFLYIISQNQHHKVEGQNQINSHSSEFQRPRKLYEWQSDEHFTIVIQSYSRTDILLRIINHYMAVPGLDKIIIVWNNIGTESPQSHIDSLGPLPVKIKFVEQKVNSLNNKLFSYKDIETECVLLLDDDVYASARDVAFGFSVWTQFRDRIVGFVARKHILNDNGVFSYGGFELIPEHAYSMALTGASFVKKDYLIQYSQLPNSIHKLVDELQNCEDIAFNIMVAKKTQQPPIWVDAPSLRNLDSETTSEFKGLWHRWDHSFVRSHCINKLADMFGGIFLKYSTIKFSEVRDCPK